VRPEAALIRAKSEQELSIFRELLQVVMLRLIGMALET
jgi:hypothetical protein